MPVPPLGRRTKLFYGFGSVAFGVKDNGFAFLLLIYYNQVLGLPERWVGLGILIALVADAFWAPFVGYLSDHLHSRWGRRHPFMYASALPVAVCFYLLWDPPGSLSKEQLFAYFLVVATLVRLFVAFYEIPSSSLAAELTDHYDERTAVMSLRFFFGWWGGLAMAVFAFAVFLQPTPEYPVGILNPGGYKSFGIVAASLMAFAILVSAAGTHSRIPHLRLPPQKRSLGFYGAVREMRETLSNRSFLALFGAGFFSALSGGLSAALNMYFNTFFWELTSSQISVMMLGNFVSAAAALAIAPRLVGRFGGKKPAAIRAAIAACVAGPAAMALRLVDWFPSNQSPLLLPLLLIINTVVVTLIIMAGILVSSMMADVVEDSELVTGRRSEGVFFAASSFMQKSVSGLGIFSSTLLLSVIGFPRGAKPGEVAAETVRNLGLTYIPLIIVLNIGMLTMLSLYNISRAKHEENLEKLQRSREAAGAS